MTSITKQQLDLLIALQENEREAARLQAELDRVPGKKAEMEAGLETCEQEIREWQEKVDSLKKDYRARENELELNQSRISKRKAQLNSVKTNREYQALLKEIDEIRETNSSLEDASLKCLDDLDAAEQALAEKKEECAAQRERIEKEKQELEKTARELEDRIKRLTGDSDSIAEKLDSGLVKQYRQIKQRSGGLGIVRVENAVCKGCHLNIPPQMYNELHRGNELRMCPHCHRLIYVL